MAIEQAGCRHKSDRMDRDVPCRQGTFGHAFGRGRSRNGRHDRYWMTIGWKAGRPSVTGWLPGAAICTDYAGQPGRFANQERIITPLSEHRSPENLDYVPRITICRGVNAASVVAVRPQVLRHSGQKGRSEHPTIHRPGRVPRHETQPCQFLCEPDGESDAVRCHWLSGQLP